MRQFEEFPKFRYTANGDAVYFEDQAAEDSHDGETFDLPNGTNHADDYDASSAFVDSGAKVANPGYEYVEYPKMIGDVTVHSAEEEAALTGVAIEEKPEDEEPETPKKASGGKKKAKADADDLL